MLAVIYARYSSRSQTEQSIEGQLLACEAYAEQKNITIIDQYIDRALTGRNDNRPNLQRMIADSKRGTFDTVLLYQYDRLSRDTYDDGYYKKILHDNGVGVVSVKEDIPEGEMGRLFEGILVSINGYYSVELARKIKRGMEINGAKHISNGSNPGFGLMVDEQLHIVPDPQTAPFVREIYEQYASGKSVTEITQYLNDCGVRTISGNSFNKNSLRTILRNKRYLGYYVYKDIETPNIITPILDEELFNKVQTILAKNTKAPARAKAKVDYILTTKLFCGMCGEMMTGYSGTSKTGAVHNYYICNGRKHHKCKKANVRKDYVENIVIDCCRQMLTMNNIIKIANAVSEQYERSQDNTQIVFFKQELKKINKYISNLVSSLEQGKAADIILEQIERRKEEKERIEEKLAKAEHDYRPLSKEAVLAFLLSLKNGSIDSITYRKILVDVFVVAVYLFDDKIRIVFSAGDDKIEITEKLLSSIEQNEHSGECSFLEQPPSPKLQAADFEKSLLFFIKPLENKVI